jgi:hypothetical protein
MAMDAILDGCDAARRHDIGSDIDAAWDANQRTFPDAQAAQWQ